MDCLLLLFSIFPFFFFHVVFFLLYLSCPQLSIDLRGQLWTLRQNLLN